MDSKIDLIQKEISADNIDCLLVLSSANITYLTEYQSRDSCLILTPDKAYYITDGRYTQEARASLGRSAQVVSVKKSLLQSVARQCRRCKLRRIGFEPRFLSFSSYQVLAKELGEGHSLYAVSGKIEKLRRIKTADEIGLIRKATQITIQAYRFIRKYFKKGVTELEIQGELERFIRIQGASKASFDIIVAFGLHTSYPHHMSSSRKLADNEPILIDMGVEYQGYKSDLTRVFFFGRMESLFKRICSVACAAQQAAIRQISAGVDTSRVDKAARRVMAQHKLAQYFVHNLGHGIGLDVHEEPYLTSKKGTAVLESGMVCTVEPGIYLPGRYGVRIEDIVLVSDGRAEVLSSGLKDEIQL
jgi:Xaa-Pro aminopeptidase